MLVHLNDTRTRLQNVEAENRGLEVTRIVRYCDKSPEMLSLGGNHKFETAAS